MVNNHSFWEHVRVSERAWEWVIKPEQGLVRVEKFMKRTRELIVRGYWRERTLTRLQTLRERMMKIRFNRWELKRVYESWLKSMRVYNSHVRVDGSVWELKTKRESESWRDFRLFKSASVNKSWWELLRMCESYRPNENGRGGDCKLGQGAGQESR